MSKVRRKSGTSFSNNSKEKKTMDRWNMARPKEIRSGGLRRKNPQLRELEAVMVMTRNIIQL